MVEKALKNEFKVVSDVPLFIPKEPGSPKNDGRSIERCLMAELKTVTLSITGAESKLSGLSASECSSAE